MKHILSVTVVQKAQVVFQLLSVMYQTREIAICPISNADKIVSVPFAFTKSKDKSRRHLITHTYLCFSYHPPTGTDAEKVEVREMLNPSDPEKNMILSMSDLHLDCEWSKNMHDRLRTFITNLASVAEVRIHQRNKSCYFSHFVLQSFYNEIKKKCYT